MRVESGNIAPLGVEPLCRQEEEGVFLTYFSETPDDKPANNRRSDFQRNAELAEGIGI